MPLRRPLAALRRPRRRAMGCLLELAEAAVITAVILVGFQGFVAQPFRVEQQSMESTLEPGEYLLVDKLTPHLVGYHRGDIIVFHRTGAAADEPPFVKRVIGLPGETVSLAAGRVLIDGQPLAEPYPYAGQPTAPCDGTEHWTVPAGALFVLGDHRAVSEDSRCTAVATVPVASVIGRAAVRYWPPERATLLVSPDYAPVP